MSRDRQAGRPTRARAEGEPTGRAAVKARRRAAFLEGLRQAASVTKACAVSGLPYSTAYAWRAADEAFAVDWDAAVEQGTDRIEDEAVRRAVDGVQRPIYQGGKLVGHETQFSDRLVELMLKARRPDKFKDRTAVEIDASGQASRMDARLEAAKKRLGDAELANPLANAPAASENPSHIN